MYEAEVTFHQGSEREFTLEAKLPSLEEAVGRIEHWAAGQGDLCRARINGREVVIRGGKVVGDDGDPFCTNPKWHEVFAAARYPRINLRPFPTNPATLIATGVMGAGE